MTNGSGDSSSIQSELVDVVSISSTFRASAALRIDGSVVTWGKSNYGGDSSTVQSELTNIVSIHAADNIFFAIKVDGTVVF